MIWGVTDSFTRYSIRILETVKGFVFENLNNAAANNYLFIKFISNQFHDSS